MADYFASIFGTEKDKVNCSFYFKIGACRHGDRCSRVHNKPSFSQTILIQNLYVNPQNSAKAQGDGQEITDEENQKHFDEFFEDIYVELEEKYGPIEEMNVCDNLGDHLIGNVYVKFRYEEDAEKAVEELNNRWFSGKPVYAELSTVTDFREAGCRQYEIGACTRGGFCNFMHLKQISNNLKRDLFGSSSGGRSHRSGRRSHRSHISRSRSRTRSRSRSRSRSGSADSGLTRRSSRRRRSSNRDRRRRDHGRHKTSRRTRYRSRSRTRSRSPNSPPLPAAIEDNSLVPAEATMATTTLITKSPRERSPGSQSPESRSMSNRRSHKSSTHRH